MVVNGAESVKLGVPQGSILNPNHTLLYMNDLLINKKIRVFPVDMTKLGGFPMLYSIHAIVIY